MSQYQINVASDIKEMKKMYDDSLQQKHEEILLARGNMKSAQVQIDDKVLEL